MEKLVCICWSIFEDFNAYIYTVNLFVLCRNPFSNAHNRFHIKIVSHRYRVACKLLYLPPMLIWRLYPSESSWIPTTTIRFSYVYNNGKGQQKIVIHLLNICLKGDRGSGWTINATPVFSSLKVGIMLFSDEELLISDSNSRGIRILYTLVFSRFATLLSQENSSNDSSSVLVVKFVGGCFTPQQQQHTLKFVW